MTGHSSPISFETQFNAFQADEFLRPPPWEWIWWGPSSHLCTSVWQEHEKNGSAWEHTMHNTLLVSQSVLLSICIDWVSTATFWGFYTYSWFPQWKLSHNFLKNLPLNSLKIQCRADKNVLASYTFTCLFLLISISLALRMYKHVQQRFFLALKKLYFCRYIVHICTREQIFMARESRL